MAAMDGKAERVGMAMTTGRAGTATGEAVTAMAATGVAGMNPPHPWEGERMVGMNPRLLLLFLPGTG